MLISILHILACTASAKGITVRWRNCFKLRDLSFFRMYFLTADCSMQIKVDRRKHSITTQKHNLPQNKLCSNYLFITFATARVRRYKSFCVRYCRKALLVAVYSTDRHVCWDYVSVVQFVGSDSVRLTFKKKKQKKKTARSPEWLCETTGKLYQSLSHWLSSRRYLCFTNRCSTSGARLYWKLKRA